MVDAEPAFEHFSLDSAKGGAVDGHNGPELYGDGAAGPEQPKAFAADDLAATGASHSFCSSSNRSKMDPRTEVSYISVCFQFFVQADN